MFRWFGGETGAARFLRYIFTVAVVALLTLAYAKHRHVKERYQELRQREQEIQQQVQECESLDEQIRASRKRVNTLGTNPLEIEADIRRTKGFVRDGEHVYRIEEVTPGAASQTVEPMEAPADNPPAAAPTAAPQDAPREPVSGAARETEDKTPG